MNRNIDSVISSDFFRNDDAVEILCSSNTSPPLIALLLQLSKKVRYKVWLFLIDHNKCTYLWHEEFCQELWKFSENRFSGAVTYANLHPVFVKPSDSDKFIDDKERYYVGKVLVDLSISLFADVLIGSLYKYIPDTKNYHPGWEVSYNVELSTVFEWYFVACALAINIDRRVLHNALIRWRDEPLVLHDKTLFIAS